MATSLPLNHKQQSLPNLNQNTLFENELCINVISSRQGGPMPSHMKEYGVDVQLHKAQPGFMACVPHVSS